MIHSIYLFYQTSTLNNSILWYNDSCITSSPQEKGVFVQELRRKNKIGLGTICPLFSVAI